MYGFPEMIDMGLNEGEKFPSKAHRAVAQIIAIGNANVHTRDMLTEVVSAINRVPKKLIKKVTYDDLVDQFQMPDVGMYS